jgi:dihydroxyacid dehydratase/phosphogluconate dehydratase
VSDAEIEARKAEMPILRKTNLKGCLARYAMQVSSADRGAIINKFED